MKNSKKMAVIMAMTLVMMLMMTTAVFATDWTDHERISVQTGESPYITVVRVTNPSSK